MNLKDAITQVSPLQLLIDYLWARISDPTSAFFLPALLSNQPQKYDPLTVASWPLGTLPQNDDQVCITNQYNGTCVGNPTLLLTNVVVKGLYNIQPVLNAPPPAVSNDSFTTSLQFSTLAANAPYVTSQYIVVTGQYQYNQLCQANTGTNPQYPIQGTGTFTATMFISQVSGTLTIGSNTDNSLSVTLSNVQFTAPATTTQSLCTAQAANPHSNICIAIQMDGSGDYDFLANQAANYEEVTQSLISNINTVLSQSSTLASINAALTEQFNNILNIHF